MQHTALVVGLLAGALMVSACQRQPETPATEVTAADMTADTMPAPEPMAPADGLPADQTTAEQRAADEAAAAAAGLPPTAFTRTNFACDNDEEIEVRFFPEQGVAVLVRGGETTELQQQRVASGFEYSNGQTTLRGKGEELTMTVGMMAPTNCTAKSA
ncbi:MAG: MliC family protein [Thermaurantiacus sp.]